MSELQVDASRITLCGTIQKSSQISISLDEINCDPSDEYACIEEAGENGYEDDCDIEDTDVDGWFVSNVVESSTYEDLRVKSLQTEKKLLDVQTTLRIMKKKISLLTNMKDVHKLLREGEE